MCGISGIVNFDKPVSLTDYYPAHLRLRHRGFDDEGFFVISQGNKQFCRGDDTTATLGHLPHIRSVSTAETVLGYRRLSIIDLSDAGHQPMQDKTGRYVMVYNGEIYNFVELRQELEQLGHCFVSQSDSEVLLTAFAQWGPDSFNRLNGMWAVAIYDTRTHRLILSRDRFGIKPLYYAFVDGTFFFSSEAKFLLPFLPTLQINQVRVMEYLVQNLVDHLPETMFAGLFQLSPAHYAILDQTGWTQHQYWQLSDVRQQLDLFEACEQLSELLTSSISLRLRSDVPIGTLLSGGLDSTIIVCILRRLLNLRKGNNTYDCFSAIFEDPAFSERRYIEATVAQTRMPIHWISPDPTELAQTLPDLIYHQEFPFRSLSVYSQWKVMQKVHQTPVVVLLDGQGSDEIFAGYTAHYFALIADYLRRLQIGRAGREAQALSQAREINLLQAFVGAARQLFKASPLARIRHRRRLPYLNQPYTPPSDQPQKNDVFRSMLAYNLKYSALPEYLRYEDRNSMAFTLESRLPFLDYRLVEWAMTLPAELKISGAASKRVLREMARPLIPAEIAKRTDKMGFVSPQEQWQRNELKPLLDSVFSQDIQGIFPFLNGAQIKAIYNRYQAGRFDGWAWVWRVACLTWWHQQWWG